MVVLLYVLCNLYGCVYLVLHHYIFHHSTIVIRPSRMAFALGTFSVLLMAYNSPFTSWISNSTFRTDSNAGILGILYNILNPAFSALRCLAIIHYWIGKNGSFSWSDLTAMVPGLNGDVEGSRMEL